MLLLKEIVCSVLICISIYCFWKQFEQDKDALFGDGMH
ncbi:hypothetical protein PAECIP111802_00268 [Paenibacillus allorhizosphaerae]|uniref:Lipoprotein n=1 Tax=Paenibacillus allorhizosphaerae TaxID=2849866 RepID=A0ABM8VAM8_9BACL|nr:hypothetical protein PAECIP111802_00268 [Paenibacillus allorhizosphaerae]